MNTLDEMSNVAVNKLNNDKQFWWNIQDRRNISNFPMHKNYHVLCIQYSLSSSFLLHESKWLMPLKLLLFLNYWFCFFSCIICLENKIEKLNRIDAIWAEKCIQFKWFQSWTHASKSCPEWAASKIKELVGVTFNANRKRKIVRINENL